MSAKTFEIELKYQVNENMIDTNKYDADDISEHIQNYLQRAFESDTLQDKVNCNDADTVMYIVDNNLPFITFHITVIFDECTKEELVTDFIEQHLAFLPAPNKEYTWEEMFEDESEIIDDAIALAYRFVEGSDNE